MPGKVYIVGAGPGDPELITLKALRALQNADVVLYDRLINTSILDHAPREAVLIYVGKEDLKHLLSQEEINQLMAFHAERGETVVRLKGGDPFVFGRGGEEALFLASRAIPFEVIPGVTSPLAGAAYAGIPMTHRGLASSYAVLTGHGAQGETLKIEWNSLKGIDTLVFLMAVKNRQAIAQQLIRVGRPAGEPVAFIEKATTTRQKTTVARLDIVACNPPPIQAPAIMVVGKVVALHEVIAIARPSRQFQGQGHKSWPPR